MANYALFTLTDNGYSFATYVMIKSFLENNAWFDGDVVILLYGSLNEKARKNIEKLYTKIEFRECVTEKYEKALCHFEDRKYEWYRYWPHMLKFEAFGDEKYRKIVFLDSDVIVIKDISELFETNSDYVICEDRVSEEQFQLGISPHEWDGNRYLNSGVFAVNGSSVENIGKLISIMERYELGEGHLGQACEQDAVNDFLKIGGFRVTVLGIEYNAVQTFYRDSVGRKITTEKILHYFTGCKPWDCPVFDAADYSYVHGIWHDYMKSASVAKKENKLI